MTHTKHRILLLGALAAFTSTACNNDRSAGASSTPEPTPAVAGANTTAGSAATTSGAAASVAAGAGGTAATASGATPNSVNTMIGLASQRGGALCVAMPASLQNGDQITLFTVPIAGSTNYAPSVVPGRVNERQPAECLGDATGTGIQQQGDVMYSVSVSLDSSLGPAAIFALALSPDRVLPQGNTVQATLSNPARQLTFRICTSTEGLHYTAWQGEPLVGTRVWHRYQNMGYATDMTCTPAETGGG